MKKIFSRIILCVLLANSPAMAGTQINLVTQVKGVLPLANGGAAASPYADATGTADAIGASYSVSASGATLYDGYPLAVGITSPNTTATPTFAPSLNGITQTSRTIVKFVGNVAVALTPGDLQGDAELRYDLPNTRWVLQNPSVTTASPKLPNITDALAANALSIGVSPQWLDFRSATLAIGTISTIFSAPAGLVVPSGATLGTVSAVQSRIVVALMNNGGVSEIAVANISGGLQMDETNLITTTAISAGATSAGVWYSNTARTNLPYRIIGYIESTQATAGTWVTAPSTIQGAGGNALTAMSSLGYGQTWQIVTRASGTTYYNTTGKPITVLYNAIWTGASIVVNGVTICTPATSQALGQTFIVPAGESYVVTTSGTIVSVAELR